MVKANKQAEKKAFQLVKDELGGDFGRDYLSQKCILPEGEPARKDTFTITVDGKERRVLRPDLDDDDDGAKGKVKDSDTPAKKVDHGWAEMVRSVRTYGVQTPIEVDEEGRILRGVGRWLACQHLRIDCPFRVVQIGELAKRWCMKPEDARKSFIRHGKLARTVLTERQRMAMVRAEIEDDYRRGKEDGGKHSTHRVIAQRLGVSHVTVSNLRKKMIRDDKDGKFSSQPIKWMWSANGKRHAFDCKPLTAQQRGEEDKAKEKKANERKAELAKEKRAEVKEYLATEAGKQLLAEMEAKDATEDEAKGLPDASELGTPPVLLRKVKELFAAAKAKAKKLQATTMHVPMLKIETSRTVPVTIRRGEIIVVECVPKAEDATASEEAA